MRATGWIASATTMLGVAAGLVAPTAAAAAAAAAVPCAAYTAVPAAVSMHRDHVVVHAVLRGSAACYGQMSDNGATATLHRPGQPDENLRWRKFGGSETIGLRINLDHTGRYTITGGDVQVYGNDYRQVPYTWRSTVMTVKHAARIGRIAVAGSAVTGKVKHYTTFGWTNSSGVEVIVQRRAVGSSTWRRIGSTRTDASGRASFATPTSASHAYRMITPATPSLSPGRSKSVRG